MGPDPQVIADARRWVADARARGVLSAEPKPEAISYIAGVLRQHIAEQEARCPRSRRAET
jgi:hypothetical protein